MTMIKGIEKCVARYESLPEKKKSGALKQGRAMVKEFVFQVAHIEGEGLDTLEEVSDAIDQYDESKSCALDGFGGDRKPKLVSTLNLYRCLCWVNAQAKAVKVPRLDSEKIRWIHKMLGENSKDEVDAGEFRRGEAWTLTTEKRKHVYMDPKKIPAALEQLLSATNKSLDETFGADPKLRVAKLLSISSSFFYKFESIHPFRDGNGRVGRLLVLYLLASIVPWGANNLYAPRGGQDEACKAPPKFVDKAMYLKCFQVMQQGGKNKGEQQQHPVELEALLAEGIHVGWTKFAASK